MTQTLDEVKKVFYEVDQILRAPYEVSLRVSKCGSWSRSGIELPPETRENSHVGASLSDLIH